MSRPEVERSVLDSRRPAMGRYLTATNKTRASCPTSIDALTFVVTNILDELDDTMLILSIYPPIIRRLSEDRKMNN